MGGAHYPHGGTMVSFLKCFLSVILSTEIWLNHKKPLKVNHSAMKKVSMHLTMLKFLLRHYLVYSGRGSLKGGWIRPYDMYNKVQ